MERHCGSLADVLHILCEEGVEEMEVNLVFLTGLLSIVSQYLAVIVTTFCIVDFFSYRTKRTLFFALSYLFLSPIIQVAIADFLRARASNLAHFAYRLSYGNLMTSLTPHLFFGLLVIGLYSVYIKSGIESLATYVRERLSKVTNKRLNILINRPKKG